MTAPAQAPAAPAASSSKKAAAAPLPRPFFTGTVDLETHTKVYSNPLGAGAVPLSTFYPKTNGYLADLWIRIEATGGGGTPGTLQTNNDGILGYVSIIQFSDTGGQPVLGPFTAEQFAMFVKWGGFSFSDDPRNSETFAEVSTSGNGTATLHIPIQFVRKEPLGPLPNTNSNNAYSLDVTQAASTAVFSVAPTVAPTVVIKIYQDSYRQSAGKDAQNNPTVTTPPGLGAVLYGRRGTDDLAVGDQDIELSQQEGSYRAIHFMFADSAGSRVQGDADWPNPVQIYFNNDVPYDRLKDLWIRKLERDYGYTKTLSASANPVGARDAGVFTLPFITDGELKAGAENRYKLLSVSAADTLGFRGTVGGSGTHKLTTLYNFVRPPGGNIKGLTAR